jgi:hypothetical protein
LLAAVTDIHLYVCTTLVWWTSPRVCEQAAHISLVESLLLCGLLGEALEAAQQLQDGPERQYLMAQAALRSGDAHGAARYVLLHMQIQSIAVFD